jgi:hypothetical protein
VVEISGEKTKRTYAIRKVLGWLKNLLWLLAKPSGSSSKVRTKSPKTIKDCLEKFHF